MSSPTTSSSSAVGPVAGRTCAAAQNSLSSVAGTQQMRSEKLRSASRCHSLTMSLRIATSSAPRSVWSATTWAKDSMSLTVPSRGWWLRRRPWHNDHSCPRSSARVETLRRPAWARVDESVALAVVSGVLTASVRTPDSDNDKALVHGRGLAFVRPQAGLSIRRLDTRRLTRLTSASGADSVVQARLTRVLTAIHTSVSYTHLRAHETRHDLVCR